MSANQTKYPQLRFKGFTDPWEKRTLGQTTTKAKSYSLSRDVERDHETGYRYIHYGDIHTGVADIVTEHTKLPNIEPANYDELRVNDLVVADASEDYQGIAEPAVVVGLPTHLVAGLHTITLRPSSASSLYLYYLLHTDSFKHFGYQMGTGLKVFGISWSNLSKFTFMIPSRPEQEMIVKLIESVDNLIAVNQRKLAKLKELKQGYLQKMFPQNGSKFPQLRFAGFADAWEERKFFESIASTIDFRGRTPKKLGMDWSDSGYLALSALNVKNGYIDPLADAHYGDEKLYRKWMSGRELKKGQVLFTTEAPMGNVAQVPDDNGYILSQRTVAFETKEDMMTNDFLAVLLKSPLVFNNLSALSSGGTAKGVSQKSLKGLSITVPLDIDEQQKIGSFFKQLDNTIALHQRKLEKLQELKKGYLQKMFC
ncbi:restriction endonuclease subunit S [Levilactobacillus brevis]|uniref:restriction endonuclease subunit S n=1 Tax=Levilactobacillus brevis TaxID=1580 RepID=UPI00207477B9|nr:restriction endonuclease subunit S [Levilactobacillus brevis]